MNGRDPGARSMAVYIALHETDELPV